MAVCRARACKFRFYFAWHFENAKTSINKRAVVEKLVFSYALLLVLEFDYVTFYHEDFE